MKNRFMLASVLAPLLFIGLAGSLLSMLAWDATIMAPLFSAPFSPSGLGNGFLLIFNRLFYISEQHQLFRYVMFPISSPQADWGGNIAAAMLVVAAIFAALSAALAVNRRKYGVVALMLAVVGVQVYFGVFPGGLWNIIVFAALALMLAHNIPRGVATVVIALGLVSAVVWVAYPGQNMRLHAFSESLRDRFDTPLNPFAVAPSGTRDGHFDPHDRALAVAYVQPDTLHEMPAEAYHIAFDDVAHGAEIGFVASQPSLLPAIVLVLSLMAIAALARVVPPFWRAAKRRRAFDTADNPAAIHHMFLYVLEWLDALGLERKNVPFSTYALPLSTLISQQYAREYEAITALWQKTVYSDHPPGAADRERLKAFLNETRDLIWRRANPATKLKIKFYYFL
ncbi:MAG: hypothetical protein FWB88_13015 [Defluviitaleaceae bacterium]|nr:hypothetical protein [Defluviitaleaceae bacterium]MCL2240822.1 hypothetical protein [Defluviitaleaceae bacterium]